jgi:hypothetical protein
MPFIVIYDAQALYPNTQRDLLIRIALEGLVQARWTEEILAEVLDARRRNHPDVPEDFVLDQIGINAKVSQGSGRVRAPPHVPERRASRTRDRKSSCSFALVTFTRWNSRSSLTST